MIFTLIVDYNSKLLAKEFEMPEAKIKMALSDWCDRSNRTAIIEYLQNPFIEYLLDYDKD